MDGIEQKDLLKIGIALSREKDRNKLFYMIMEEAVKYTNCDGGTLYICEKKQLRFKIMITKSKGICRGKDGEEIDIPPVPMKREHVCACAAMLGCLINIKDVYDDKRYDFSGPRKYDALTGYHTKSMLVVPMENDRGEIIGVLQLINAQDLEGRTVAFESRFEEVITSLASQAAISLANMNYAKELQELLASFVRVMSAAVDARSPYNANHTRNMARYAQNFMDYLNKEKGEWRFTEQEKRQFVMSVWLHDIGKLVIPLEVMDKNSRLGKRLEPVRARFREMELLNGLAFAQGRLTEAKYRESEQKREEILAWIERVNSAGTLSEEELLQVRELGKLRYKTEKGEEHAWMTEEEVDCLSIRKGTLSEEERRIMESHVVTTHRFLSEIQFTREYENVTRWTFAHHEFINGEGYPNHLSGPEVEREVRLLTILDIFDSLTAKDRPYKQPVPLERALAILEEMAERGQLDADILKLFRKSKAWEEAAADSQEDK